ncbi:MAG: hypothetical protein R6V56_04985 [Lentisphaeria bacterium]
MRAGKRYFRKCMAKQNPQRRVALAVGYPSGYEGEIVRGAIDYAEHLGRWTFVGRDPRPFQPFEQIDLGAVDGVIGNFYKRLVGITPGRYRQRRGVQDSASPHLQ